MRCADFGDHASRIVTFAYKCACAKGSILLRRGQFVLVRCGAVRFGDVPFGVLEEPVRAEGLLLVDVLPRPVGLLFLPHHVDGGADLRICPEDHGAVVLLDLADGITL